MNDDIIEIYNELKQADKSLSQRQFCAEYLGMCETYLFASNYYGRKVSKQAVARLRNYLNDMASTWAQIYEEHKHPRYKTNWERLSRLTQKSEAILFGD